MTTAEQNLVTTEIGLANGETGFNGAGWSILTPTNGGSGEPQEFLVYTPESSAVILFGADMLGLAALAFFFRRRLVQTEI